ncbi:hypothetical protein MW887_008854 [Aspergillus wentii]|nr:hypothetical protein MW887_008854 [Aspergillus wentii]
MDRINRPLKRSRHKAGLSEDNSVAGHNSSFGADNSGLQLVQNNGNITANFQSQSDYLEASENRNCLRALHATNPHYDKTRIETVKGGLLEDAYIWALENEEFKRWRYEQESQLLWVRGDPGKGKTMLLCGIINELTKTTLASETTVVFFFCQAADARINHATGVLRGFIFMLVDRHPSLISHVRREYDKGGEKVFEDANAWETLVGILTSILQDPLLQTTYLIIDALDECTTGLDRLLHLIVEKSSVYPHVKWLVSSRNWPSIEQTLESASKKERLWLELNEASVSKAVATFICYKVQTLTRKKNYPADIQDAVYQHLLANAHGTFLWVALVCEELAKFSVPKWAVRRKLEQFPPGLDKLYRRMLDQIGDTEDAELCRSILGISTTVYHPLTLDEISSYVDFPEDLALSDLEEVIGLCGSFLTIRGSTIFLVHQSAKDFLHREAVCEIFPRGQEILHHDIFAKSLDTMARTLRRDIYNLVHPGYPIDRVVQPEPDPLAAVRYACLYWVDHLEICYRQVCTSVLNDFAEGGPVDVVFCKNYLHWLEAIGLLRSVSGGIVSILKLENLIERQGMVWDTGNRKRVMAINNLDSDFVSVTFLHDSKYLASGSTDGTIKLWDTRNGKCLKTLKGHDEHILALAKARELQLLASASLDETIKIWDINSGACIQTLNEHNRAALSVAFSHDSQLLASGSFDNSIKLWETSSWKCLRTLSGDTSDSWMNSVRFSHDSKLLASGLDDHTITLWDTNSGKHLQTFKGHGYHVRSVAFSPDSKLLVSASSDHTVRIWNATSRQHPRDFASHSGSAEPFFSHDSRLLATGAKGEPFDIKVWDARNGQCLQSFNGWDHGIHSLMFSHNLKLLVSQSWGSTVRVLDVGSGKCLQTFNAYRRERDRVLNVRDVFLNNPDLKLFDGTVGLSSFSVDGPNSQTHKASPYSQGFGITWDYECITWNSKCLLWLPPEYRPDSLSSAVVTESTMCICCASGRVLLFTFDSAILSNALAAPNVGIKRS